MTRTRMQAVAAIGMLSFATTVAAQTPRSQSRQLYEDMRMFSQVLNQIRVNHPDSLDAHALLMAAIEGMVRAADPHSYVISAMRLSPEKQEAAEKGKLFPVPISFAYLGGLPVVISVHPGTKTARLDILPGDELLLIDGDPVTAESPAELEILLSGKKGSKITLTFIRRRPDGSATAVSRDVQREKVEETPAVGAALMLDSVTGYLGLVHFARDEVAEEVHDSLESLDEQGMQRLVFDLRDNGGGLVAQASQIAGEFLPDGTLLYTVDGRKPEVRDTVFVEHPNRGRVRSLPVVVLVNQGTASAAELLVGALQDHDRALVVGHPTFGKSLLMRAFPMTDGSLIYLVIGLVKTPCGRTVQRPYRNIRTQDYYRFAGLIRDTTRLSSCRTEGGRTVYGGGGIFPDVLLELPDWPPRWMTEVSESQLLLRWVGRYLQAASERPSITDLAQSRGNAEWGQSFIAFAIEEGVDVPEEPEASVLYEMLVRAIAWGVWGPPGLYTVNAMRDSEVNAAVRQLDAAKALFQPH